MFSNVFRHFNQVPWFFWQFTLEHWEKFTVNNSIPGSSFLNIDTYPCLQVNGSQCLIEEVKFRGCNCTEATGREFPYRTIMKWLEESRSGRIWDTQSKTPWFFYSDGETQYQVWYDDLESLQVKYLVARDMGMKGVGFWTANFLDYANHTMVKAMWDIIPSSWNISKIHTVLFSDSIWIDPYIFNENIHVVNIHKQSFDYNNMYSIVAGIFVVLGPWQH